ncbi:MAG: hypothetical protein WKF47_04985 [Geodermatophilaceae bacterium]
MVQENEQWRIAGPPRGIYITRTDFARAYEQRDIYFLDGTSRFVVPDPRFFVRGGRAQSTQLVERLLAGPEPVAGPAVVNQLADMELASSVLVTGRQGAGRTDPGRRTQQRGARGPVRATGLHPARPALDPEPGGDHQRHRPAATRRRTGPGASRTG